MGGRFSAAILVAAVTVGAAGAAAAEENPIYLPITDLLPGLVNAGGQDRGIPCPKGKPRCVDRTLKRMRRLQRRDGCDHKGLFLSNYIVVTREYARIARTGTRRRPRHSDHFEDPAWLAREDALFAKQYFVVRRHWREGRRDLVPEAWRIALGEADARSMTGLGDLLLGISAHVNNDMPFMIAGVGLRDKRGRSHKVDHDRFNRALSDSFDDVLEDVAARYDPAANLDVPGTELEKTAIYQLLALQREAVWRNAERLESARTNAERRQVARSIEDHAALQSRLLLPLFRSPDGSVERDAYCRAQLG
ncbi:MAG: hypothetical protein H0U42_02070 [Thermoleophilaceae bacterium]|nr:hypothetical protein [Thermoleophilaceae bacterium]